MIQSLLLTVSALVLIPSTAHAAPVRKSAKLQCVVYANMITHNPVIHGVAKNIPINSHIPIVGAVVKTRESRWGHVAIVTAIQDGYLILSEANYDLRGSILIGRRLAINSPKIVGYIIKRL